MERWARHRRARPPSRVPVVVPDGPDGSSRRRERLLARRELARRQQRRRRVALAVIVLVLGGATVVVVSAVGGSTPTKQAARPGAATARRRPPAPLLLPRGGRTLLPGHLIVAYYGIVGTSNVLGRTRDADADAAGVERASRAFHRFGRPVRPAFELVTTIASPDPGRDGTYSSPIADATLNRYVSAARRHKLLLVLDFQPGRGEFLPQVRRYARLLLDPGVGVALDPEWKLAPSQIPGQIIGASSAAAINAVSAYLSALVISHHLPQKLFVIHQFRLAELPDRAQIRIRRGLATVLQMDGLGPVAVKRDSYRQVMRGAGAFDPGFKVFLRPSDDPIRMTPAQVMGLRPRPDYVSYQ